MKKLIFFLYVFVMLGSCTVEQPCNTVNLATQDYLNVKIVSSTGIGGFVANGYSSFEVAEVGQSYPTDYNSNYDENYYIQAPYTSLKLPIAHNYDQTTFIFKGDTVAPDTIRVNNYNARAELTADCGYRLTIDEPQIVIFTYAVKSKPVFDLSTKILTFQIQK